MSKTKVFLSHTGKDKPIVREIFENLLNFTDIDPWLDIKELLAGVDLAQAIASNVLAADYVLLFWSKNTRDKYQKGNAFGNLSWVSFEIRTALNVLKVNHRSLIAIRLDDTEFPDELNALLGLRLSIDGSKLINSSKIKRAVISQSITNQIIAAIRGRPPIYTTSNLKNQADSACRKNKQKFFVNTWIYGGNKIIEGSNYIDLIDYPNENGDIGRKIPAFKYKDGNLGYRISILNHTQDGWWAAGVSFDCGNAAWCSQNLSKYTELRFNAKASIGGVSLLVKLEDSSTESKTGSCRNQTSSKAINLANYWGSGKPHVILLDSFDWSVDAAPGNSSAPDRSKIVQITFHPDRKNWPIGPCTVEIKDIVIL